MDNRNEQSPSRQQRSAQRAARKRPVGGLDRAELICIATTIIETDTTISGCTIIQPDGRIDYLSANLLRRKGGRT
jgi:hypothetical protein